jgi:acetylornithine deacetylase
MTGFTSTEILRRLVAFPTVSRHTTLPLIDWVRDFLADQGVVSHLVPSSDGSKANLFASLGPLTEEGLVLSGHTDVVPVDGQRWTSDPFVLTERGSRLYGRGACDRYEGLHCRRAGAGCDLEGVGSSATCASDVVLR